jgi:hypothetical protein
MLSSRAVDYYSAITYATLWRAKVGKNPTISIRRDRFISDGVLRECWQGQLMTTEACQAAISMSAVRGESERRDDPLAPATSRESLHNSPFQDAARPNAVLAAPAESE